MLFFCETNWNVDLVKTFSLVGEVAYGECNFEIRNTFLAQTHLCSRACLSRSFTRRNFTNETRTCRYREPTPYLCASNCKRGSSRSAWSGWPLSTRMAYLRQRRAHDATVHCHSRKILKPFSEKTLRKRKAKHLEKLTVVRRRYFSIAIYAAAVRLHFLLHTTLLWSIWSRKTGLAASLRDRAQILKDEYLLAEICFDTVEQEPSKVSQD